MENALNVTRTIMEISTQVAIAGVGISIFMLLYRVIKGPTNPDRAVALDVMGITLMALAGLVTILLVTTKLNDVVLLIGILLFIGTIALAKFIEKGVIIERDNH
ncbi:Na(+)/H(+) antiporter subunit F1 [Salimicrobium humidisoli]|uniref:Na(+)/H(+) antiporter subunit F n=1 Tax=Salimicrobium humidisoli TaxID=2029857 RepID=A0ABX4HUB4_9BACI|nr:Na(+)/H(+) antiporter subunit F1 [Salimicrobium humidisoli]PBB06822.1 Na(+)/H(+) antiporter subunit F [Salimicrobium humidisoli]